MEPAAARPDAFSPRPSLVLQWAPADPGAPMRQWQGLSTLPPPGWSQQANEALGPRRAPANGFEAAPAMQNWRAVGVLRVQLTERSRLDVRPRRRGAVVTYRETF